MKINLNRLLDVGRFTQSDAGKQLADFIDYMGRFVEQAVSALANGLTFADNFNGTVAAVTVRSGVAQSVKTTKTVAGVFPIGSANTAFASDGTPSYALDTFVWWYDGSGSLNVKATFTGTPAATVQIPLTLVLLYA